MSTAQHDVGPAHLVVYRNRSVLLVSFFRFFVFLFYFLFIAFLTTLIALSPVLAQTANSNDASSKKDLCGFCKKDNFNIYKSNINDLYKGSCMNVNGTTDQYDHCVIATCMPCKIYT
jgi:hypothetical protein